MRFGQPDVQGHEPGLGAEAGERQRERDARPPGAELEVAHRLEAVVSGAGLQDAEAQQDGDRAEVRDQEVEVPGAADLGVAVVAGDEEVRRQRHRLPGHHEEVGVVGEEHQRHAGEEEVVAQALQAGRRRGGGVVPA